MKKIILLQVFICCAIFLSAQNVGVGTTAPAYRLDVSGGSINTDSLYRIEGKPVLSVSGSGNTFAGINAGIVNTSGLSNTGHGYNTLLSNTTGNGNTALGTDVLRSNSTGSYNTASGVRSLYFNSVGQWNAAVGYEAMLLNVNGSINTAMGAGALYNNTSGSYNAASGGYALYSNTTGSHNTAGGSAAMYYNTTGSYNTASGYGALNRNISGLYNVADGYTAMEANVSGAGNTAIGYFSLSLTTASNYNTALGYRAGYGFDHGWNNTLLGTESNVQGTGMYNSIAIGSSARATASNQVRIGNTSTISTGGYTSWTNISDGRFKKNIKEDVKGIDFIMKLRPVTYQLDVSSLSRYLHEPADGMAGAGNPSSLLEKEKIIQTGFIAQEVEKAAKESGYDFSGVDKPKNENDLYGLRYSEFVVPLVKAIQEQQAEINELKKIIAQLRKQ
ncbi:MAG TPA: tail fiber domain-containing protein [Ferruginibacter sp.]|nr:hypothetical protein [Chitinophagaceae bacterium]HRI24126.1 tail fiber domain-containing protein [Ferruginibacter sp.]